MKLWNRVALAGTVLSLAACASSLKTNFYTLSGEPALAQGAKPAAATGVALIHVSIAQVAIPEIVDRRQLVVRTAPNRVEIADFHQWAEPLRLGIARALVQDLATQLGARFVVLIGQPAGLLPEVRVSLDVQKLEAVRGESVTLEMVWSVRPAKGEVRSGRSSAEERVASNDYAAIAAAYSRALARVARDIGAAIAALQLS